MEIQNQTEVVELLKKNNALLEEIVTHYKKEERAQKWRTAFHIIATILPFLIAIAVTWYLFDLVNSNIQALKENVDLLKDFVTNLVPDFSGIGDTISEKWNGVWN